MLTFRDSFSQMAVSEAATKYPKVREQIAQWVIGSNQWPSVCLTPEGERDKINPAEWEYSKIVYPEESHLKKIELYVCRNDVNKETGIPREINFNYYYCKCDKYGIPDNEWKHGGVWCNTGAMINHGTEENPSWSIHT